MTGPVRTWPSEDAVRRLYGEGGVALLRELVRIGPSPLTAAIVSASVAEASR
jgi:hypothetical protein